MNGHICSDVGERLRPSTEWPAILRGGIAKPVQRYTDGGGVEPMHESSRGLSREKQVEKHDIEIDIVDQELRTAGFEIVQRDTEFVKVTGVAGGFWLILARRP